MSSVKPITIVVACDNHYMILLAALLKSIELNHVSKELIHVIVVEDNVSKANKDKLRASIDETVIELQWIKMADAIPEGITLPLVGNSYPLNTYIRLLIPYFIPKEINKVIFLDVDMIVQTDISKLWNIDIGDKIIGAVKDTITNTISNGISNYQELGLNPDSKYFNAGLQIINTKKWLENNITEKIFKAINENKKYAGLGDQYGLNIGLADQWHEIDTLWNYFAHGDHPHPYLIHFFHRKPIYTTYSNNPQYKELFYFYLKQTKWSNFKPIGEVQRYFKKISNMLEKLPLLFAK